MHSSFPTLSSYFLQNSPFWSSVAIGRGGIYALNTDADTNLQPSEVDLKITRKIKEAGALLDAKVLDHIILADEGYLSLADENQL